MNTFLLLLSHINSRVSCHSDIEYEWKGRWVCELLQKEEASSKEDTGSRDQKNSSSAAGLLCDLVQTTSDLANPHVPSVAAMKLSQPSR